MSHWVPLSSGLTPAPVRSVYPKTAMVIGSARLFGELRQARPRAIAVEPPVAADPAGPRNSLLRSSRQSSAGVGGDRLIVFKQTGPAVEVGMSALAGASPAIPL